MSQLGKKFTSETKFYALQTIEKRISRKENWRRWNHQAPQSNKAGWKKREKILKLSSLYQRVPTRIRNWNKKMYKKSAEPLSSLINFGINLVKTSRLINSLSFDSCRRVKAYSGSDSYRDSGIIIFSEKGYKKATGNWKYSSNRNCNNWTIWNDQFLHPKQETSNRKLSRQIPRHLIGKHAYLRPALWW